MLQLVYDRTPPWDNVSLREQTFALTNEVLNAFLRKVQQFVDLFVEEHNAPKKPISLEIDSSADAVKEAPPNDLSLENLAPTEGLGGIISWFQKTDDINPERRIFGTDQDNRKLFSFSNPQWDANSNNLVIDRYMLWRRGDRNWRYTFFEGIAAYPNPNEQIRAEVVDQLEFFLKRLFLSKQLKDLFPDVKLEIFKENPNALHYPFPGARTAGAQYFVIPSELLLLVLAHIDTMANQYLGASRLDSLAIAEAQRAFNIVVQSLSDLENNLLDEEKQAEGDNWRSLAEVLGISFSNSYGLMSKAGHLKTRLDAIHRAVARGLLGRSGKAKQQADAYFQGFATLAERLWKVIYSSHEFELGYDDFVALPHGMDVQYIFQILGRMKTILDLPERFL